jgi:hypothetical protein
LKANEVMTWPRRSRHFLRIGKHRFIPVLLFVQPSHFTRENFDVILSVLYEKLPQELALDPQSGNQMVASPYHPQRPCHYSNDGLHFCHYWITTPTPYTMLIPKTHQEMSGVADEFDSEQLSHSNRTLIICVLTSPNLERDNMVSSTSSIPLDDPMVDMSAITRTSNVSQYFSKASNADQSDIASSSQHDDFQSNHKKRKRESDQVIEIQ